MREENAKCACQGGTLMRFVQPIILSLLSEAPDHGYELVQKIGRTALWNDTAPDSAGVYRVLRDMEKRGLVQSRLDADSIAGVGKRVFAITDEGRACMRNWLQTLGAYQKGIQDVIERLTRAVADSPADVRAEGTAPCCCGDTEA